MEGDVTQLFDERQIYNGEDVVGEDGEACVGDAQLAVVSQPAARRRKRNSKTRCSYTSFFLDSKWELLPELCSGIPNWRAAASIHCDWDLLWSDGWITPDRFAKLKPYQKMNHFVGMSSITRKNHLGRNLLRMRKQFPTEYQFFPDTWILPTDLSDFRLQFTAARNKTFIIKPDNSSRGRGIFLVRDVDKVPVDFSTTYVAQRYVHKPFLLDGFKFDLRLYVLVMGCDPLRIFLHRRGLVRLASEKYVEPTAKNIKDSMVHLTNYSINKDNPNFEENTNPDDAQDGHKRSWEAVQEHLRNEGHDVDTMLSDIEDCIIKTLIAVQPSLSHFYHSCQPDDIENGMCFEILGFDIMLDSKLQPRLLEVNHAPSFGTDSELDRIVKAAVLLDTFALLNLSPERREQKKREQKERMEQLSMGVGNKAGTDDRVKETHAIAVQRTAWEDAHLNGFKRLYPSEQKEREYMQIHDAAVNVWEVLTGGNSRRAVRLGQPPQPEEQSQEEACEGVVARRAKPVQAEEDSLAKPCRTMEEIRKAADRLMAGEPTNPSANAERRRRRRETAPHSSSVGTDQAEGDCPASLKADLEAAPPALAELLFGEMDQPALVPFTGAYPKVQVGSIVQVQTNMGWEPVTVKAKRVNGRLDIQFRDGEEMRNVVPRIRWDLLAAPDAQPEGGSAALSTRRQDGAASVPLPLRPRPGGAPPRSSSPKALRPRQQAPSPVLPLRSPLGGGSSTRRSSAPTLMVPPLAPMKWLDGRPASNRNSSERCA